MNKPRYFVAVFGDPSPDKDPVESGVYTAGPGYPLFPVSPGDVMLLYCTAEYIAYSMKVAGLGIVLRVGQKDTEFIEYRWIPFVQPIPRVVIERTFEPADWENMQHLGVKARRVFEVKDQSFSKAVAGRMPAWEKL
jgi:hypothetical protein